MKKDAIRNIKEDLADAEKIIEKTKVQMKDGRIADKYVLYFQANETNELETGYAVLTVLDNKTVFWSKSKNLEALLEFENNES